MIVKKHTNVVQANHLVENRPNFTKDETRLFLTVIGAINKDDDDFKPLKIPVTEFADLWGIDSKNAYTTIKNALRGLRNKEFYIEGTNPETGKRRFITSSSISTAVYEEGEGYATVEVSSLFKPYLLALKEQYTSYVLKNIMDLSTVNAIRNYELLKQYQAAGTRTFTLEEYKKVLHIADKYPDNTDLKRYVIEPSISEINSKTDIFVTYEFVGRGKKAKVVFEISGKKPLALTDENFEQTTLDDFLNETDEAGVPEHLTVLVEFFPEFTVEQLDVLYSLANEHVDYDRDDPLPHNLRVCHYIINKVKLMKAQSKPVAEEAKFSWVRKAIDEDWQ